MERLSILSVVAILQPGRVLLKYSFVYITMRSRRFNCHKRLSNSVGCISSKFGHSDKFLGIIRLLSNKRIRTPFVLQMPHTVHRQKLFESLPISLLSTQKAARECGGEKPTLSLLWKTFAGCNSPASYREILPSSGNLRQHLDARQNVSVALNHIICREMCYCVLMSHPNCWCWANLIHRQHAEQNRMPW